MSTNELEIAQKLITFQSQTPTHPDTKSFHMVECSKSLDYLEFVTQGYVASSERLKFSGNDPKYPHEIDNLVLRYRHSRARVIPRRLLIIAHTDVVPVNEAQWTYPPYEGVVKNGRLYGRGATDMKGPLASCIAALNTLVSMGDDPASFFEADVVITTDEEYAALNGVKRVLEYLKEKGLANYDAVLILEPSSPNRVGRVIATGRRGSYNGTVRITGRKGHRAYSHSFDNPIPVHSKAICALYGIVFDTSPEWRACTDLEVVNVRTDSDSTSVIASYAELDLNIRFTGDYTPERLKNIVSKALEHLNKDRFEVNVSFTDYPKSPFLGKPKGGRDWELLHAVQSYLMDTYGEHAELTHEGGMSDGCHVPPVLGDIEILEIGPNTTPMHQNDEYIEVADLAALKNLWIHAIPQFCRKGQDPSKLRYPSEG